MIEQLAASDLSVSDLAAPFDMALPSFMKHIRILEDAGLIVTEKTGRRRMCQLQSENLQAAEGWVQAQRDRWASRMNNLDNLLNELQRSEDHDPK